MSNIERDEGIEREIEKERAYFSLLWYFEGLRLTGSNL